MGAVVGAALAVGLPELLRDLQGAWLLAYAVATLAVVLWAPEGLAGLLDCPAPPAADVPGHRAGADRLRGARPRRSHRRACPTCCRRSAVRSASSSTACRKRFGGVEALADVSLLAGARRDRRA